MKLKVLLSTIFIFTASFIFAQETVTITGKVRDENKQPLAGATVLEKGTANGTTADNDGNYTIKVSKDAKALIVSYIGYDPREIAIDPSKGTAVNVDMISTNISLNQVVVSVSRRKEKLIDAPASISVISHDQLERNVVTTPADELKTTAGVDVMRTGLVSSNVVVRGFNDIFSGSVLYVIDNRIAAVPSLRVNAMQLSPTSTLDYDKIEVVRGPASALYGPNASSGVISVMTKSPLDQEKKFETTIAMNSGFTVLDKSYQANNNGKPLSGNIINPELRHSGKLLDGKFGYKISGSYFQGQDYPLFDPRDPHNGDSLVFGTVKNGTVFQPNVLGTTINDTSTTPGVHKYDTLTKEDIRRFKKDFMIREWKVDGRIDIRPIKDITITINGGIVSSHNLELTGLGQGLAGGDNGGWMYWYLQARFKWKNLFIQYFINSSDAGNTYLIPSLSDAARTSYASTAPPTPYNVQLLIDKSKLHVFQVQHSWAPIEKLNFVYGVDVQLTRPNTEGTINGRFENVDNLNQAGAYLQGDYDPLKWLKLVAAIRVDYNSIIKNAAASPRAAVVFKVAENQNIRLTYNRAFDSPNTLNQFLDLSNGLIPNGVNVRGIGNPYGYNYNYGSNGEVQFRTAPWGGNDASPQWVNFSSTGYNLAAFDSFYNYLRTGFINKLMQTPGETIQDATSKTDFLVSNLFYNIGGPASTSSTVANAKHVSIDYAAFAQTGAFQPQNVNQFQNLKKINNEYTNTVELGYKGLLFHKLSVSVDVYWTRVENYVSALTSASGAVMLDHNSYLGGWDSVNNRPDPNGQLYKNLYDAQGHPNIIANNLDAAFNKSTTAGTYVPAFQNSNIVPYADPNTDPYRVWKQVVVLTYQIPIGTITPNNSKVGSDYILTFKNLGRLDQFGLDLGFQYNIYETSQHKIDAGASFSWVDKDQLILSSGESVSLNAPKEKMALTFDHLLKKSGFGYGLTFRYQAAYYGNSSIYQGPVKAAYLLDARVSYRPKFYKGLLLSINVNNVTNYQWASFPGTPLTGTQFYARAQVTF